MIDLEDDEHLVTYYINGRHIVIRPVRYRNLSQNEIKAFIHGTPSNDDFEPQIELAA